MYPEFLDGLVFFCVFSVVGCQRILDAKKLMDLGFGKPGWLNSKECDGLTGCINELCSE